MPYIPDRGPRNRRKVLEQGALDAGELNFEVSTIIADYCETNGVNYQTINDISGVLTEALAEFRRRITVLYEDSKRAENGDIPFYRSFAERGRVISTGPVKREGTSNA